MFKPEEIEIANKTSRANGAVGIKAITPKYVEETASPEDTILDFGAGKDAVHTLRLNRLGLNVTAHEFGSNANSLHSHDALLHTYDIVYASNVINVQSSLDMLHTTLKQIALVCKSRAIMNFPMNPRKGTIAEVNAEEMQGHIGVYFSSVKRVGGTKSAPLYECIK